MPSPAEQLLEVRKSADRLLSFLLVLHLPAAFGLAVLYGTWLPAILVGGAFTLLPKRLEWAELLIGVPAIAASYCVAAALLGKLAISAVVIPSRHVDVCAYQ